MTEKDYYEVLGLPKSATKQDIKSSFRKLAKKYHPDVYDGDPKVAEEKFKKLSEAYEVLADPEKKAKYDRYGIDGLDSNFSTGGFQWSDFTHQEDVSDIFGDFFGGRGNIFDMFFGQGQRRGRRTPSRGADLRQDIQITLKESFNGKKVEIPIERQIRCPKCKGERVAKGSAIKMCNTCGGTGQIRHTSTSGFTQFVRVGTCPGCRGEGKTIENPCDRCRGRGTVPKKNTVMVSIPKGVEGGTHLRISGEGEAGPAGTPSGDLYVVIHVQEDDLFEREGPDLFFRRAISFPTAALGGEVLVKTMEGKAKLKVPAGTQTGTVFKMKGKGMPFLGGGGHGDLYIRVDIQVPTKLKGDQKRLLKELERTMTPLADRAKKGKKKGFFHM